jgi:hypothetical protein
LTLDRGEWFASRPGYLAAEEITQIITTMYEDFWSPVLVWTLWRKKNYTVLEIETWSLSWQMILFVKAYELISVVL